MEPFKDIQVLFENLHTAILLFDRKKELVAINPAGENMLSSSLRSCYGLALAELLPDFPLHEAFDRALLTGQPFSQRNIALNVMHGQQVFVDCTLTPIVEGQFPSGILLECFNISQQHQSNREDNILARQKATNTLIRGMAHEIKNPLGGIRGAAQLLEKELKSNELKEYTGVIIEEVDRLRKLLDRILGPTDAPDLKAVNIHETLEHVFNLVSSENSGQVTFLRDYDPSMPNVVADPHMLIQAEINMVRNAIQASEHTGAQTEEPVKPVTITLKTRVVHHITIGHKTHKFAARIDIIDDGPGIPREIQETVFLPMVTGRAEGTGLGLSIAQTLINKHQGYIDFTTHPGETVFTIWLPFRADSELPTSNPIEGYQA